MAQHGESHLDWLTAAKVTPPQPLVALIDRPAARATLNPALRVRLTLVISPAGFGKTTLLAQWRHDLQGTSVIPGWLTLDEDDADPLQLLSSLVFALTAAGAAMGELEKMAAQGFTEVPAAAALSSFLNTVARLRQPVLLILDDYHRLQSAQADRLIESILARAPDTLHMVLSSRERPPLALSSLKAQGLLHEVGAEVLRFSVEDALPLFEHRLDPAATESLVQQTEGWGVALQLARLWLEGADPALDPAQSFSGRSADVADYLTEQVFNDLPAEAQAVLLETSVCERINGDLANAITGRSDCWEILSRLERLHALLIPLDRERRWLRCHLLFRDFLQESLQRRAKDRIPALHLAASRWFEAQGMVVEAVRHARLADDYDRVTALVAASGGWELVLFGGIATLRSLLRNIAPETYRRSTTLRLARIYLHIKDGELAEARALFDNADADTPLVPGEDPYRVSRDLTIIGGLIDGYEDKWLTPQDLARVQAGTAVVDASDHLGFGCLYESIAVAAFRIGDGATVEDAAIKAVRSMRAANSILGLNYAYFHLGQVQMIAGRLREARASFAQALATAEENFGSDSGQKAIADVLLAGVLYLTGDLEAAERHLIPSMQHVEAYDSWFDVLVSGYETATAVAFARQGPDAALAVLDRGEDVARRRNLVRLRPLLQAARVRVHVRAGDVPRAAAAARSLDFVFTRGEWRTKSHVWRTHHQSGLALAGLYLAQGAPGHALEITEDLRRAAADGGRGLHLAQIAVLEALAHRLSGRHDEAQAHLMEALRSAMTENILRIFLDEGTAMEALLGQALRQQRQDRVDSLTMTYVEDLLEALRRERGGTTICADHAMSERELEVLGELARGYSNKEIARALNMTENTVKFHLKNIYAKLDVDKRGAAVARARAASLIL